MRKEDDWSNWTELNFIQVLTNTCIVSCQTAVCDGNHRIFSYDTMMEQRHLTSNPSISFFYHLMVPVGPVSVQRDRLRQKSWSPCFAYVWQHVKLSDVSLGTGLRDSLVADNDIKKPTN